MFASSYGSKQTCADYITCWLGILPMQLIISALVVSYLTYWHIEPALCSCFTLIFPSKVTKQHVPCRLPTPP